MVNSGLAAISSRAANGLEVPRGLSQRLRSLAGAKAVRVIEGPGASIAEHAHDWPVLSLYVIGSCTRIFDETTAAIAGPCAVLHPPGAYHSSTVGTAGLEQIDIEFDPSWLPLVEAEALKRVHHWRGGRLGDAATRLATLWLSAPPAGDQLSRATANFIRLAATSDHGRAPKWLRCVQSKIDRDPPPTTMEIAQELDLHPAWLAQAYRHATGEGLQQTLIRKRVERAVVLLRHTADPAAEIAVAAGFCDQSHMIRCFRQLLWRTPKAVRSEVADPSEVC